MEGCTKYDYVWFMHVPSRWFQCVGFLDVPSWMHLNVFPPGFLDAASRTVHAPLPPGWVLG